MVQVPFGRERSQVEFMIRDSKIYADTLGGDSQGGVDRLESPMEKMQRSRGSAFGCHSALSKTDYVLPRH